MVLVGVRVCLPALCVVSVRWETGLGVVARGVALSSQNEVFEFCTAFPHKIMVPQTQIRFTDLFDEVCVCVCACVVVFVCQRRIYRICFMMGVCVCVLVAYLSDLFDEGCVCVCV